MRLTIITPTYNEADNLPGLVSALFGLAIEGLSILVVDDNSPDGTGKVAEQLAKKYPEQVTVLHRSGKLGLRTAYIEGFNEALRAGAQAIAQMDADWSHPPEMVLPLLDALATCDVALGSRYVPGGGVDDCWSQWRKFLSAFGNLYARTILGLPIHDVTSGFKIWRRDTLLNMPLDRIQSNGYAFQIEMAYVAYRLGFSFQEVPFYFVDRRRGSSKMSFRIQREAALRVWQMRFKYRHLTPVMQFSVKLY